MVKVCHPQGRCDEVTCAMASLMYRAQSTSCAGTSVSTEATEDIVASNSFLRCYSVWGIASLFSITIEEIGQILRMLLFDFHCESYLLDNSAADPGFSRRGGEVSQHLSLG